MVGSDAACWLMSADQVRLFPGMLSRSPSSQQRCRACGSSVVAAWAVCSAGCPCESDFCQLHTQAARRRQRAALARACTPRRRPTPSRRWTSTSRASRAAAPKCDTSRHTACKAIGRGPSQSFCRAPSTSMQALEAQHLQPSAGISSSVSGDILSVMHNCA